MVGCAAIWARDLEPLDGDDAVELSGRTYLGVPDGVADSKMLTEHRREAIFDELRDWCAAYAVGQASNAEIDEWAPPTRLAWPPCARSANRTRTWLTAWRGIDDKKRLRGSLRGRLWKVVREAP